MATGAATAPLSLTVRLTVGPPAQDQDSAGDDGLHAILPERAPQTLQPSAILHPAVLSAVAGSARRLLALAGASPGADVGVLSRAMDELERLALAAGGTALDRLEQNASTAADMDIDSAAATSSHLGGAAPRRSRDPGAKRKLEAPGTLQRPAKRRILAWRGRGARQYRSSVARAQATARRRASGRRARAQPVRSRRRKDGSLRSVHRQLARATLGDGLHRWSPGGGGGGPAAEQ